MEAGAFGGTTFYWNDATGELLARTVFSDAPSYCEGAESSITLGDFTVVRACENARGKSTVICDSDDDGGMP